MHDAVTVSAGAIPPALLLSQGHEPCALNFRNPDLQGIIGERKVNEHMERLKNWFKDQGLGPEDIPKVMVRLCRTAQLLFA